MWNMGLSESDLITFLYTSSWSTQKAFVWLCFASSHQKLCSARGCIALTPGNSASYPFGRRLPLTFLNPKSSEAWFTLATGLRGSFSDTHCSPSSQGGKDLWLKENGRRGFESQSCCVIMDESLKPAAPQFP